jgi:hypothetical protein
MIYDLPDIGVPAELFNRDCIISPVVYKQVNLIFSYIRLLPQEKSPADDLTIGEASP